MASNLEMIGREDVNDLEAILAVTNTDADEIAHSVTSQGDAIFTWDYERSREALEATGERPAGVSEERVAAVEGDVREHELRFVREHELERTVRRELVGCRGHDRHDRLVEGVGGVGGGAQIGRDACALGRHRRLHQLPLATEVAVEARPGAAGLAGNVVEGGLGQTVAGGAGEQGIDGAAADIGIPAAGLRARGCDDGHHRGHTLRR